MPSDYHFCLKFIGRPQRPIFILLATFTIFLKQQPSFGCQIQITIIISIHTEEVIHHLIDPSNKFTEVERNYATPGFVSLNFKKAEEECLKQLKMQPLEVLILQDPKDWPI